LGRQGTLVLNNNEVLLMDFNKSNKITWSLNCLFLFSPILIERYIVAPITLNNEPLFIWGTIHWIYCYIAYGTACYVHFKWRKKINYYINPKPSGQDLKWICTAILMGIIVKRIFDLFAIYVFNDTVLHISAPMIYRDVVGYIFQTNQIWLGVGTFIMQYIYYIFEFTLIAFIVDCAQNTSMRLNLTQKIPWGGIFLIITIGLGHRFGIIPSAIRGEFVYSIRILLQCLVIGFAYILPGKKPLYAFFATFNVAPSQKSSMIFFSSFSGNFSIERSPLANTSP
jgi:hypothetical protein